MDGENTVSVDSEGEISTCSGTAIPLSEWAGRCARDDGYREPAVRYFATDAYGYLDAQCVSEVSDDSDGEVQPLDTGEME